MTRAKRNTGVVFRAGAVLFAAGTLLACARPGIREYEPRRGVITGTVLVRLPEDQGPGSRPEVRGRALVFLYAEDDPPPPAGSGRPVNFVVVPEALLFGEENRGVAAAPFVMPSVPEGRYQLRGFLDADGDFVPTVDFLAEPTAGDVAGGHVDPATGALATVEVSSDRVTDQVTVTLAVPLPVDRPAFAYAGVPPVLVAGTASIAVELRALAATTDALEIEGVFPVRWVDFDGDGRADDTNQDGAPDVFPLAIAEELDPGDPEHLTPRVDGARIFGVVPASQFEALGFPVDDPTRVGEVRLTDRMTVVFPSRAVRASDPTRPIPAPPGVYRVTLINSLGQTWAVPNALSRAEGTPLAASQGATLTVAE